MEEELEKEHEVAIHYKITVICESMVDIHVDAIQIFSWENIS